ncbi:MAG: dienelactone hydrolase-like enzyme [Phycisphaerales bacterium]|nr:dienelactone hydrolase-like enzyme [Phycisphaerales bacterium]MDB5357721.1 dienelactone hydrolase-like enzyme [Phycisphaerales bacterium]
MNATPTFTERQVRIPVGSNVLHGDLTIPDNASGIVLFAHGSGSSRFSPRNRFVAGELQAGGMATLLMDLLTADEELVDELTAHLRFDIGLLADRLVAATDWLGGQSETRDLPVGYFGASTGGGAALVAAAARPDSVAAVVSRGGRPDLAGDALPYVKAPTLLIVGGNDPQVIALNRQAMARMRCEKELRIVPGATHLFEEPGALEEVARLAREWFTRHFQAARQHAPAGGA